MAGNGRTTTVTDFAGEKGYSVTQGSARKPWFRFEIPDSTVITTQQSIQIRISALVDWKGE